MKEQEQPQGRAPTALDHLIAALALARPLGMPPYGPEGMEGLIVLEEKSAPKD